MKALCLLPVLAGLSATAGAGELDDLVRKVHDSRLRDAQADQERTARFLADRNRQQQLLSETKSALAKSESESKALRDQFAANEVRQKELNAQLKTQSGDLGILFGAVKEFAGKLKTDIENSLTSAEYPGRAAGLDSLAAGTSVPNVGELETLWTTVLQELAESGKAVKFDGRVTDSSGERKHAAVYRIGPFSVIANGKYLRYSPKTGELSELPRQPDGDFLALASGLESSSGPLVEVPIDPSRGAILESLAQTPSGPRWVPRILQGLIGNAVDAAVFGVLLIASIWAIAVAVERWLFFRRVDLGEFPSTAAAETELSRNLTVIGTVAANAPFVGLLGTVLGIMMTFHRMGTEKTSMDVHHIMIGLSTALKATAIGLVVAIPCVVMNNLLRRRIRELVTAYEVRRGP